MWLKTRQQRPNKTRAPLSPSGGLGRWSWPPLRADPCFKWSDLKVKIHKMLFKDFKPVMCLICTLWTIWDIFICALPSPLSEQRIEYKDNLGCSGPRQTTTFFFMFGKWTFCVLTMLQRRVAFEFFNAMAKKMVELDLGGFSGRNPP